MTRGKKNAPSASGDAGHSTEFFPAAIGGEWIEAVDTPPSPKINLHSPEAIRQEMGRVYRDMRAGRIEAADGTRLTYVLRQMIDAYRLTEMDERLQAMEHILKDRK